MSGNRQNADLRRLLCKFGFIVVGLGLFGTAVSPARAQLDDVAPDTTCDINDPSSDKDTCQNAIQEYQRQLNSFDHAHRDDPNAQTDPRRIALAQGLAAAEATFKKLGGELSP